VVGSGLTEICCLVFTLVLQIAILRNAAQAFYPGRPAFHFKSCNYWYQGVEGNWRAGRNYVTSAQGSPSQSLLRRPIKIIERLTCNDAKLSHFRQK